MTLKSSSHLHQLTMEQLHLCVTVSNKSMIGWSNCNYNRDKTEKERQNVLAVTSRPCLSSQRLRAGILVLTAYYHFKNTARIRGQMSKQDVERLTHTLILFPIEWIIVTVCSQGSLKKLFGNSNLLTTPPPGSWQKLGNTTNFFFIL